MRRSFPLLILIALITGALALIMAVRWIIEPTTLRIAVGPPTLEDHRLMLNLAALLRRENADIRLKIITTNGSKASAGLLDNHTADLALIRSDVATPINGTQVAVLHKESAILLAPPHLGIHHVSDMRGKTIGVVRGGPANIQLLERLLAHYDLPREEWSVKGIHPNEIKEELSQGRIHAVFALGSAGSREMDDIVAKFTTDMDQPVFIPLSETQALVQSGTLIQTSEIAKGAFGGSPPKPSVEISTIAVSYRLLAHRHAPNAAITSLTQLLFSLRTALAADTPTANQMEAPDTEPGNTIPIHPGSSAYFDGDIKSFMEQYGDWFYILVMMGGIFGSLIAATTGFFSKKNKNKPTKSPLLDMARTFAALHTAKTQDERAQIKTKIDAIYLDALFLAEHKTIDDQTLMQIALLYHQAHAHLAHPLASA